MAALNEEQAMIRDQAEAWVSEQAPVQKFRQMRDSASTLGYLPEPWAAMIDMGWTGIVVPEQYGGSELGFLTFGVVLEQTGRHLVASPLFASALAGATALGLGGSETLQQALLPRVVDGSAILSLAIDEGPRHTPDNVDCRAQTTAGGFVLDGKKTFVHEGMSATHLIVSARTSGAVNERSGISLFLVETGQSGVSRQRLRTVDSRGYANIEFNGVEVSNENLLGELDGGFTLLDAILDRARAGLAAEMLGTAAQAFDMTLDYLKTRVQFGQVIGSFQALGHRAAGLFSTMELTRSCVEAALQAIDTGAKETAELCSLSKCRAGDFLHQMSNELIQIHGGIGMTDEFDAGFYLKRARVLEAAFGNQAFHRDRFANLLDF